MANRLKMQNFKKVIVGAIAASVMFEAQAFNSDEHKLIVDSSMANLSVPASVTFPNEVSLGSNDVNGYLETLKAAKRLAVGFDSNNPADYDPYKAKVQDNCYWYGYGQLDYNRNIRIPFASEVPDKSLTVASVTGSATADFTMGELASLYGDYRRTSHCDNDANCYLTNAAIDNVVFEKGNVSSYYCPNAVSSDSYLKAIGSGVVPPFGSAGNLASNTADHDEYQEAGWWGDEMLRIANVNDWHFANAGVAWYIGMHRQALHYVNKARTNPKYWVKALHHEANALHSLTDLFAFGHVVTNRGKSSYNMVKDAGLNNSSTYSWMESILMQGGAVRNAEGIVSLNTGSLPTITVPSSSRNEFIATYRGQWALWAKAEHDYHNEFNKSGATARNLMGDTFQLYGDGKLVDLSESSKAVIIAATKASVQSLLDAYVALENGSDLETVGASGSAAFAALKYIPVYIESDGNNYFTGSWTRYAEAVNSVTGMNKTLNDINNCQIPYLSGADWTWPSTRSGACTSF